MTSMCSPGESQEVRDERCPHDLEQLTTVPLMVSLLPAHGNVLKFTHTGLHRFTDYILSF